MKYIRFRDIGIVMFPVTQSHDDIARKFPLDRPVSAGRVISEDWINNGIPFCTDESLTLGLTSGDDDDRLLRSQLKRH